MAAFSEMNVRRRLLKEYIRRSSQGASGRPEIAIKLQREIKVRTGSGGVRVESTNELPTQVFALMPFKRRQTDEDRFTAPTSGRDHTTDLQYLLIAPIEADVDKNDWFLWESEEHLRPGLWKVEYVAGRRHDRKLVGIYYHALGK